MARQSDHQAAIDRLYGLPLGEFTQARDELARGLRREGERDAAAAVKRLSKPSVAAWALNRLRRSDPGHVDRLIAAGDRIREAQQGLLRGGGREALDRATEEERRLVAELARQAERELAGAGRPVSAAIQEKLRQTLHAAATDPEAREGLSAGRLVRDHAPSGLGPLLEAEGGRPSTAPRERRKPRAEGDGAPARRARELEERLERTRAKARQLDQRLSKATRGLREARREAARASAALERAEAAEEQARARAQEASEHVAQLEADLREVQAGGRGGRRR
jgi:DNA repair exonuclease SbcCD ATPase subunit